MPSNNAQQDQDENATVRYEPLPSIYRAFASGASGSQAIAETVDNSIDHVRSRAEEGDETPETLEVTISYWPAKEWDDEQDVILIEDNAGGVPPNGLGKFFQLGRSETPERSIGRFGVGAKRLIALGNKISYQSRAKNSEQGWGFDVDASEFAESSSQVDEEIYESERYQPEVELDEGSTRIVIRELKTEWKSLLGYNQIEEIPDRKETKREGTLLSFDGAYENFLRDGIHIGLDSSIDFELKLQDPTGEYLIEPPEETALSYLPFDELAPKKYAEIPFESIDEYTGEEKELRVDITVGLMVSSDPENAGLTVSMNNRNVLFRSTQNDLFSSNYLGKFRPERGHGRLVCRIDIRGSSRAMPWNDLKTGLDPTMQVSDDLLRVAENALAEYRRQGYTALPDWMLSAYPETEMHAANGGEIDRVDKSNSKRNNPRFNKKPGKGIRGRSARRYPERDRLKGLVRLHSELRIVDDDSVKPYEKPAYYKYFDTSYIDDLQPQDEFTTTSPVNVTGPDEVSLEVPEGIQSDLYEGTLQMYANLEDQDLPPILAIKNLVKEHAERRNRVTEDTQEFDKWRLPRYEEELKRTLNSADLSELDEIETVEKEPARKGAPEEKEDEADQSSKRESESGIDQEQEGRSSSTTESENPTSSKQENKQITFGKDGSSKSSKTESDEEAKDTASAREEKADSKVERTDKTSKGSDESGLAIRVPGEKRESLYQELGLPEDTDSKEVEERALERLTEGTQRDSTSADISSENSITISMSDEKVEAMRQKLGLPEDATPAEVAERATDILADDASDESQHEDDEESGSLLFDGLDDDEREEVYRVLEVDSDASPEEKGERLLDVVERFQRIRSMIS